MNLARLSTKSQVVIPVKIRRKLDLHPGDMVEIRTENDRIVIRKAYPSALANLEECISDLWRGYENEVVSSRDEWDE
jgi:AbrB family looped-hinge helix DNA binding protein